MNALSWRTFFVWLFCFEGPKHKIWVIHTFETPASLRVLAQTFNWGSDRNILSGSELRKRNLAIEVFRSQWPTQCAHMSDIPDFNRFCRKDRKILRALLDFFSGRWNTSSRRQILKMQNEKYTFIFILNVENMESALPVKRKIKKLWPNISYGIITWCVPWYVASIKFAVLMKCKCFKLPLLLANALSFHKPEPLCNPAKNIANIRGFRTESQKTYPNQMSNKSCKKTKMLAITK